MFPSNMGLGQNIKISYLQFLRKKYVEDEEPDNSVKIKMFQISFQRVLHFGVGRSQIEWKLKFQFSHTCRANIGRNDHSNSYDIIVSTTVPSDTYHLNSYGCEIHWIICSHFVAVLCLLSVTITDSDSLSKSDYELLSYFLFDCHCCCACSQMV